MNRQNYFMEQLCTIGVAGTYGGVMTAMFFEVRRASAGQRSLLSLIAPWIQNVVLIGSLVLLVLVILRAIGVWRAAGQAIGPDHHDHDHDHNHAHEHGHEHNHAHDHGHDHSWSPWRYAVLVFPLLLFFMGVDYNRLIADFERDLVGRISTEGFTGQASSGAGEPLGAVALLALSQSPIDRAIAPLISQFGFEEWPSLQYAVNLAEEQSSGPPDATFEVDQLEKNGASEPFRQQAKKYRRVEIQGMFSPMDARRFQIVRMKMACCMADARVASVFGVSRKPINIESQQWVKAMGRLDFMQHQGQWKAVLRAFRVTSSPAPANPYLN